MQVSACNSRYLYESLAISEGSHTYPHGLGITEGLKFATVAVCLEALSPDVTVFIVFD